MFEDRDTGVWHVVMELVAGGDLYDRIMEKEAFSERDARDLIRLLLSTVRPSVFRFSCSCLVLIQYIILVLDPHVSTHKNYLGLECTPELLGSSIAHRNYLISIYNHK